MAHPSRNQLLALAGVFQAATLVQQIARHNQPDRRAFNASIKSVLQMDGADPTIIYGGQANLEMGLKALRDKLGGGAGPDDFEVARYVLSLLQLAKKLSRKPGMIDRLGDSIQHAHNEYAELLDVEEAEAQADSIWDMLPEPLIERLAAAYSETISTLTPRIMVSGEHGYLSNPITAARVRAALLAGIRAAWLWLALGGKRWQLLFRRAKLAEGAANLLKAA